MQEHQEDKVQAGYLLQYADKTKLGETFTALIEIADQEQTAVSITYRQSIVQLLQVKFGNGTHEKDLEAMLLGVPNVVHVEKDYLEKKIE